MFYMKKWFTERMFRELGGTFSTRETDGGGNRFRRNFKFKLVKYGCVSERCRL